MKIIKKINHLNKYISNVSNIGFVPTMGGLHNGHLSLINESKKRSDKTLVSIFINPTQFDKKKDFLNYPRNLKKDLSKLKKKKVDFVFIPTTKEIFDSKRNRKIVISNKYKILCYKFRKGHFEGVLDIVERFLKIIHPKFIFFGEKDYQQYFLINKYFKKKFKTKIILCKTIRDKNKIALSSRNLLLKKNEIEIASLIAKKLIIYKNAIKKNIKKYKNLIKLKKFLNNKFKIKIDYLEIRDKKKLSKNFSKYNFKIFIAYHINKIRLIDNF